MVGKPTEHGTKQAQISLKTRIRVGHERLPDRRNRNEAQNTIFVIFGVGMRKKTVWAVSVLSAFTIIAGALLFGTSPSPAPESKFLLLDATQRTTADFKGRVTLVNFWATSCTTCVAEMPELVATYEKYHLKGFDTLAVAMQYDPPSYVVNFAASRKLPFQVAIDNTGTIARAWGDVQLTPTSYLVNKRGEIVKTYVGQPDFKELHRLIDSLLAEA